MAAVLNDKTILMATQADAVTGWYKLSQVRWEGSTTAAHLMTLHDAAGKEIITMKNQGGANEDQSQNMGGIWVNGITLDDLDSGEVRIYVE